mmetsp:Transcript_59788/g.107356  ORF Transcript_59788/g.107356 Transcript_59788/m.107356 type:complete len:253 (-) Transcript_59788:139-897(-)
MALLLFFAALLYGALGGNSEATIRRHELLHSGVVNVSVSSTGAVLMDGGEATSRSSHGTGGSRARNQMDSRNTEVAGGDATSTGDDDDDVVTDPKFAHSAGKWKVHYDGWPTSHPFQKVEIFCDGKFKLWNGHLSKLSTSDEDKKALCKGTAKAKIQWVSKNWAGDKRKWECGWYDSKEDKIHVYHYIDGSNVLKEGHKEGDHYWGKMDRSKREADVNCPTPAPAVDETSGTTAMGFLLLAAHATVAGQLLS